MSDLLQLAASLRASDDASVLSTLRRRSGYGSPKDFFDLAQGLLTAKSLAPAITKLSGSEARALSALITNTEPDPDRLDEALNSLRELGLVYLDSNGACKPYEAATEVAKPLLNRLAPKPDSFPATGLLLLPVEGSVLGLAAISAFETQQAVCELLLDAEQHHIKLTGKTGFGVNDVKRLAAHLRRSNQSIRGYYQLAEQLQLLGKLVVAANGLV
ncbi:MAG: hypothetical protein RJA30_416, partial [Actinomycetota bacterium]